MEEFKAKYIEDATDLLNELEQDLLSLEKTPEDKSLIEKAFRAMHTLKGVSSMYGFENISELTHDLETIYDLIRDELLSVTREILDVTFHTVDHLLYLLAQEGEPVDERIQKQHDSLLSQIAKLIEEAEQKGDGQIVADDVDENEHRQKQTYYILFQPEADTLRRGVNLLSIPEELKEAGDCYVFPHLQNIPLLDGLKPKDCYAYWEFFFSTDKGEEAIEDVFMFVPDEIKLSLLAEGNLLENEDFVNQIKATSLFLDYTDINELKKYISDLQGYAEDVQGEERMETEDDNVLVGEEEMQTETEQVSVGKNIVIKDHKIDNIRVASEKLDELTNLVSELVTTQAELSLLADNQELPQLNAVAERVEKLSRQLRDSTLNIRLLPIQTLIVSFQRLVRDLSHELNKTVNFVTEGTQTELDKTIIDQLTSPVMHIIRNSMDHGIEPPEERRWNNKAEQGTISLKASHLGTNVLIEVADDGRGIDVNRVREKAISRGLIAGDSQLTDKELYNLIFMPGFSTAQQVSEISGRGVGMDVVKRRINEMRGDVAIDSRPGEGTTIRITLPLTLSIVDALLVAVGESHYLIPLSVVDYCDEVAHEVIADTTNQRLVLDKQLVPFIYLRKEFGIESDSPKLERVVVIAYDDKRAALIVDRVVGEHQAVLKPLGDLIDSQDVISGASILGDGSVALVIDTNRLIAQYNLKK